MLNTPHINGVIVGQLEVIGTGPDGAVLLTSLMRRDLMPHTCAVNALIHFRLGSKKVTATRHRLQLLQFQTKANGKTEIACRALATNTCAGAPTVNWTTAGMSCGGKSCLIYLP